MKQKHDPIHERECRKSMLFLYRQMALWAGWNTDHSISFGKAYFRGVEMAETIKKTPCNINDLVKYYLTFLEIDLKTMRDKWKWFHFHMRNQTRLGLGERDEMMVAFQYCFLLADGQYTNLQPEYLPKYWT